jgi:hypothetical protein
LVEYQQANANKLLILLFKDCVSVRGTVHLDLSGIIAKLIQYYKIADARPELILQETLIAMKRALQSYFYHRVELDLAPPKY